MEDYLVLEIPNFKPHYKKWKQYGYKNPKGIAYSAEDLDFIEAHIQRFRLNDVPYRTCKLYEFVKNIVDSNGSIPSYEYNNLVVEIFAEKLRGKTKEDVLKICNTIYVAGFLTMQS